MPRVIDAPEAVQEERWHQYDEKTEPLLLVTQPQCGWTGVFTALWSGVTALLKRPAQSQPHVAHTKQRFELPIDRVAREHPFLYIKAMSG